MPKQPGLCLATWAALGPTGNSLLFHAHLSVLTGHSCQVPRVPVELLGYPTQKHETSGPVCASRARRGSRGTTCHLYLTTGALTQTPVGGLALAAAPQCPAQPCHPSGLTGALTHPCVCSLSHIPVTPAASHTHKHTFLPMPAQAGAHGQHPLPVHQGVMVMCK